MLLRNRLATAGSLLALGAHLAGQVATAGRDVHGQLNGALNPLAEPGHPGGIAALVYGLVRGSLDLGSRGLGLLSRELAGGELALEDERLIVLAGIVNGVFGDTLAARGDAMSLPFRLLRPAPRDDAGLHIVFLHGLCMSERGWLQGAHPSFVTQAQDERGAEAVYARYNSGRHIAANGADCAQALQALHDACGGTRLLLVGHSMGGLVARSALHQAQAAGLAWPSRVEGLVTLGSPHQGAGLEQLGNYANRMLRLTPFSAPLTRLGNLRSAGIRDLRFGNLRADDRDDDIEHVHDVRTPVAMPAGIPHLLVAATRTATDHPEQARDLAGDLLVGVDSALARGYAGLEGADRVIVPSLDHMALMWDGRVYDALRHWLARIAA